MGEMASSVAHELNQPLTAITNYCNGMVSRVQGRTIEQGRPGRGIAEDRPPGRTRGQIIHRIRAFVKRSEPQRQAAAGAADRGRRASNWPASSCAAATWRIHTYVAQRLPPCWSTPSSSSRWCMNLLKNAAEAIDSAAAAFGAPAHRAARRAHATPPEEGGVIEFSVTDKGPGLKEEVIARLYEAFFSTKAEGLGIGLSLCRTIVESHRGRMRRRTSTMAGGRRLPFLRSLCRSNRCPSGSDPHRRHRHAAETEAAVLGPHGHTMSLIPKKGTVYVVDDDEAVRDSLQWLLEGKDYRVKCFDSAESFLSRFDPREVACLIADIRMDGMSGLELQDRLIERKSPLPIVFITGHGDVPMAVTTMKKGAMDFIEKPFKEEELLAWSSACSIRRAAPSASTRSRPAATPCWPPDHARGPGAGAHRGRPAEQADRRRPGHQHQDGGGAPRQHHGKAQRQHGGRSAQDRPGRRSPRPESTLPAGRCGSGLESGGRSAVSAQVDRWRRAVTPGCAVELTGRVKPPWSTSRAVAPASPSCWWGTTRPARCTFATRSGPVPSWACIRCSRSYDAALSASASARAHRCPQR
jgi:CheY-like chemotaxis protein